MKNYAILLAAAVILAAGTAWAQDSAAAPKAGAAAGPVIGGNETPAKSDAKTDAKTDAKDGATAKETPAGGDLVSPDATNALDTEDLIKKLTGQETDNAGPEKALGDMLDQIGHRRQAAS